MEKHYFTLTNKLEKILKKDDYNEFIKTYNSEENITKDFNLSSCSHKDPSNCPKNSIASIIFEYNFRTSKTFKISEYAIKNYKIGYYGLYQLISKFKSVKKEEIKTE